MNRWSDTEPVRLWRGYYSNVSQGKRQKENQDGHIPYILEQEGSKKEYRKNWARLIQKIYEVDPLTCPKCHGQMRIISFIEDEEVTRLPCLSMTCNGYELWEMKRGINLVIGCQGQWRAGQKDPQAPWVVGNKDQTSAQGQCTAKGSRILYRLHGSPASGVRPACLLVLRRRLI